MELDAGKIPDPDLQRFARAGQAGTPRSVIVEVEAGPAAPAPPGNIAPPRAGKPAKPAAFGLTDDADAAMSALERELASLGLGRDVVRLNAAQAFVVTVGPEQLRALSRLPVVGVIRPNRTHRAPKK